MNLICPNCKETSMFAKLLAPTRKVICPVCEGPSVFKDWKSPTTLNEEKVEQAVRHSEGKNRFDLIPPEADLALAEVLTMGAKKYADRNWEKGGFHLVKDIVSSLKRHLNSWELGEDCDEESGFNHTKHVLWNAMALCVYIERGAGVDDRPSKKS